MKKIASSLPAGAVLAFAAILAFNFLFDARFFHLAFSQGHLFGTPIDIGLRAAPLLLTALGMTFVIATAGVDLSVGAVAALAPATAAFFVAREVPIFPSLLLALAASACVGAWNSCLVVGLRLQPIIATLITMVAGRGFAQLLVDGQVVVIQQPEFSFLGRGWLLGLPVAISVTIVATGLLAVLSRRTALGLFIEAVGSNATASRYAGVNTPAIKVSAYVLSSLLAGLAGLLMSSNIQAVDANNLGLYLELDAILAVVIGGTRLTGGRYTLLGTVFGALIIQTVSTMIHTRGVAIESMLVVKAVVVIMICLLQSSQMKRTIQSIVQMTKKMTKKITSYEIRENA